jgi:RimJ/RimL family protein N-acetyltransferase
LPTLLAITVPHNGPSIRLLRRLGFDFERETRNPDGEVLSVFRRELGGDQGAASSRG